MKRGAVLAIVGAASCAALAGAWFGIKAYAAGEARTQIDAFVERHSKFVRVTYEDVDVALPSRATTIKQVRLSSPTLGRIASIGRLEALEFETRPRNVQSVRVRLREAEFSKSGLDGSGIAWLQAALGTEQTVRGDFEVSVRLDGEELGLTLEADVPAVAAAKGRIVLDRFPLGLGDAFKLDSLFLALQSIAATTVKSIDLEVTDRTWFDGYLRIKAAERGVSPAQVAIHELHGAGSDALRPWQEFIVWGGAIKLSAKPATPVTASSLLVPAAAWFDERTLGLTLVREGPAGKGVPARQPDGSEGKGLVDRRSTPRSGGRTPRFDGWPPVPIPARRTAMGGRR